MKMQFLSWLLIGYTFFIGCTEKIIYENGDPNSTTGAVVGVVLQNESNAKIVLRQEVPVDSTYIEPSDGSFRMENLPVGNYNLYVKAANYGTYWIHNVIVNAGGVTYVGQLSLSQVPDMISSFYPQDLSEVVFDRRWSHLSVSINFTRPMDRESVEAAFSIEPPCDGIFYWGSYSYAPTPRYFIEDYLSSSAGYSLGAEITTYSKVNSFTYRMAQKDCYVDTTYTVALSTAAEDTAGNRLEFPLEFSFSTIQSTSTQNVILTQPEHGDIFVNPMDNSTIHITFPRRMDQASVESELTISPSTDAILIWSSGNELGIYTGGPLRCDETYAISIGEDALDLDGIALGEPFSFSFQTAPVEITGTYPQYGQIFVSRGSEITIYFNTYMILSSIRNAFSIEPDIGGSFKRGTRYHDTPKNAITFIPSSNYAANKKYTVTISPNATDLHYTNLPEAYTFSFVTEPE